MFVQYLVEQVHIVVKSERKPRRNIQYRDVANAVARIDNLEFLADVVPRTIPYKTFKLKKAAEAEVDAEKAPGRGQRTLNGAVNADRPSEGSVGEAVEDLREDVDAEATPMEEDDDDGKGGEDDEAAGLGAGGGSFRTSIKPVMKTNGDEQKIPIDSVMNDV